MVQGLSDMGLKTICDVVYNHTQSAGPSDGKSVLDKIVPGYYHRRNFDGGYENSTCCNNTASENWMMERLIVDDLVHWARTYKIDGFRFDLMGHLMLRTILRARRELDALTLERDGVDGRGIYMYGEGVGLRGGGAEPRRGEREPAEPGGTGIGSFNDTPQGGNHGREPVRGPQDAGRPDRPVFLPERLGRPGRRRRAAERPDRGPGEDLDRGGRATFGTSNSSTRTGTTPRGGTRAGSGRTSGTPRSRGDGELCLRAR